MEFINEVFLNLVVPTSYYFVLSVTLHILVNIYVCNKNTKTLVQFVNTNMLILSLTVMMISILIVIYHHYVYNYIQPHNILVCSISLILLEYCRESIENLLNILLYKGKKRLDINSLQGLDYGTGMAHNFYNGYLKLIVPPTESLNKGLVEKIENMEDIQTIKIATYKLFILIPSSSYMPPDLKEISCGWMESAMNLEKEIRNRAGVKGRMYHNSVYKIYPNGDRVNCKPTYVVAEGATPLLTFFEVTRCAYKQTEIYKEYCKDIVLKFYETLKELIDNDPGCAGRCELIYYDDYDSNGSKINVAKIILDRLDEIQRMDSMNNA
ncbi:transmembrane protein sting [Xylocopa sonorina]|uniref:transmembrane protein sting n=1 Tax=Xylocopa sonorina TaxID=1818115 RepID=UPI00403B269D